MYAVFLAAINRRLDGDPYNIRKSLDLGGNTDNVRIIYNSARWLLADVSLSVDLYCYSNIFGEGLRGFWPPGKSEDSLVMSTRTSILIAPILALIGKL